jgi:PBP1b-binding outer membrane lipoprotein LpoB
VKKVICVVSLAFLLSGCAAWNWFVTDNPDAPDVHGGNGKPPNWPVFKETNTVNSVTNATAVKDAKVQGR